MDASDEADDYDRKVAQLSDEQIRKAQEVTKSISEEKEKQRLLKIESKRLSGDEAGARALEEAYQNEQLEGLEKQRIEAEKNYKLAQDNAEKLSKQQKENFAKEKEFRERTRVSGGGGTSASIVGITKKEIEETNTLATKSFQQLALEKNKLDEINSRIETKKLEKANDRLKSSKNKPETVQASAPKNFTLNIAELGRVENVTIATVEDEKAFQQQLVNALMSAMTTAQARVAR